MSNRTLGRKLGPGAKIAKYKLPRFSEAEAAAETRVQEYAFTPFYGGEKEVTLTLEEAKKEAETIRVQARAEAEQLIQEASATRSAAHQQGFSEGFQKGHAEGLARGREEGRRKFEEQATPALESFRKVEDLYQDLWRVNEAALVKLALQVAERIVLQEVQTRPETVGAAFKAALDQLHDQHQVLFRLHPDDLAALEHLREDIRRKATGLLKINFEPEENLSRGDLVMECEAGRLDATLRRRIENVVSAVDEALKEGFDLDW
ncbi:MAG: FliH/SctL family protein [Thermodesulfobacteriota bacterium]